MDAVTRKRRTIFHTYVFIAIFPINYSACLSEFLFHTTHIDAVETGYRGSLRVELKKCYETLKIIRVISAKFTCRFYDFNLVSLYTCWTVSMNRSVNIFIYFFLIYFLFILNTVGRNFFTQDRGKGTGIEIISRKCFTHFFNSTIVLHVTLFVRRKTSR